MPHKLFESQFSNTFVFYVAHAVQNPQNNDRLYPSCYFAPKLYSWKRNIKYIKESQEYKFISNPKSFKH